MIPFKSSIRRQLLTWLVVPIIVLWTVCGAVAYYLAIDLANDAYDRDLADSARTVGSRLKIEQGRLAVDLPPAALAILTQDDKDKLYFQVIGPYGERIAGDARIPAPPKGEVEPNEPDYYNGTIEGRPVRIATIFWPAPGKKGHFVLIQMAQTLVKRTNLIYKVLITVVVPELLLIISATLAVWVGVSRGLAPLKVVADAVASRSQWDLSPLTEADAPKEVRPLVRAINDLLARLQKDIEAQRRFVANAAHQLRTPLAGLKTQTQLAVRQTDLDALHHALKQIHTSADRCARLVNQLLVLARVEPGAIESKHYGPQDLASAVRLATEELVPDALRKGIDLGFEGPKKAPIVYGEPLSLHELAFNLIENAVRYTQAGGKVTVRVESASTVKLIVEDNGPGIPDQERERVFERFYRVLGTSVNGSGLGLAIVREIAGSLGASVYLDAGPKGQGTQVTVEFTNDGLSANALHQGVAAQQLPQAPQARNVPGQAPSEAAEPEKNSLASTKA